MDLLRSSILGQEFVNYRKTSLINERIRFSNKIRNLGLGYIPVIIDSVDPDISKYLSETMIYNNPYYYIPTSQQLFINNYNINFNKFGRPLVYHMDNTIENILMDLLELTHINPKYKNCLFTLGLEDGTFPDLQSDIGTIYKLHRNKKDRILYLLLTKEQTVLNYILSILNYLKNSILNYIPWGKVKKIKTN